MKAAVYDRENDSVTTTEIPVPETGRGEILLRPMSVGLCASELIPGHLKKGGSLGHEVAGIVHETGPDVKNLRNGDRVFIHHHVPCMNCHFCDRGRHTMCPDYPEFAFVPTGYAEFARVRERHVRTGSVVLPDNVSFDEACVTEPVSCILRGFQAADMKLGDTALIIGSGFIGLVALQMARLLGAGLVGVSDIADAKLGPAAGYGADFTVNSREQDILEILTEKNQGRKADIVFNSAPAIQAVSQALDLVERGGTIVQFGGTSPEETVPINPYVFITREITFLGTYSSSPAEARSTVDLVAHGKLDVKSLITDHYPLDRIGEAFRNKRSSGDSLKVVIHPNTT